MTDESSRLPDDAEDAPEVEKEMQKLTAPGSDADEPATDEADAADEEEGGKGLPKFVTTLASMETQVGTHVIAALQHPETTAVITTVVLGDDGHQRIVSVGLDPETLDAVRDLLGRARKERTDRVPCVGFHCRIQERDMASDEADQHDQADPPDGDSGT